MGPYQSPSPPPGDRQHSQNPMANAPQEHAPEHDALPDYLATTYRAQKTFLAFADEEEARRYGFLTWENLYNTLEFTCKPAPHDGGGCHHHKSCAYCKVKADDRSYNPLLLLNIEDLGIIRRALLDLTNQQTSENWAVPDRQATLQNLMRLIGNNYLLPSTRPFLKNWGYMIVPETMWPQVKQTPNRYNFRTAYALIGNCK